MDERDLGVRVAELQRPRRRLQGALVGAAALGAVAWLAAARAPADTVLRAQAFELLNAAGEVCGRLALDQESPTLVLYAREAGASVALRAGPGPHGPLEYEELGNASLVLRHSSGSARMLAGATAVTGQDERQLVLLEGHGPYALLVTGHDNLAYLGESARPHPFSTLDMRSEPGSASATSPAVRLFASEKSGSLEIGTGQTPRTVLRYLDGEPSLSLQDAAGTTRFRAP